MLYGGFTYKSGSTSLRRVTSLVKSVTPPFDVDGISMNLSIKRGVPQYQIIQEWANAGKKGTEVHRYIETRLEGLELESNGYIEEKAFDYFWKSNSGLWRVVSTEQVIGDADLTIGGTIDCILFNTTEQAYQLIDWKTGKFSSSGYGGQMMLPPFEALENCKLSVASIQLALYEMILRRNIPDINLITPLIVHLHDSGEYKSYHALPIDEKTLLNLL